MKEQNFSLETLATQAVEGNQLALDRLILGIQSFILNISLKFLWHPEDAKDASQEILIRIVTHLSSFRQESSFKTWAYRIAHNYLLNHSSKQKRQIDPKNLLFASKNLVSAIAEVENAVQLLQSNPEYDLPEKMLSEIRGIVGGRFV